MAGKKWLALEDHYQVRLEMWENTEGGRYIVALGGSPEVRERLVELGGKKSKFFGNRNGGLKCVSFPPIAGKVISAAEWLAKFPEATMDTREDAEILRVKPDAKGLFSEAMILGAFERSAYWDAKAREAVELAARRAEAAEQEIPSFDFGDAPAPAAKSTRAAEPAPAVEAPVAETAPVVEPALAAVEAPVAETAPVVEPAPAPVEAPVAETAPVVEPAPAAVEAPVAEIAPVVEPAPAPVEAPVAETAPAVEPAPAAVEAPVVETAPVVEPAPAAVEAPVAETAPVVEPTVEPVVTPAVQQQGAAAQEPVAPPAARKSALVQYVEAIHADDDRQLVTVNRLDKKSGLTDKELSEILEDGPSGLLLLSHSLKDAARIVAGMPSDMQGAVMIFGRKADLQEELERLTREVGWPVIGAGWGSQSKGSDRLVILMDGTVPAAKRLQQFNNLPDILSEAATAGFINNIWSSVYEQQGEIVSAPAAVSKPGNAPDVGAGASAARAPGVRGEAVVDGVEATDGARPDGQDSGSAGRGRHDAERPAPAGGADADLGRGERDAAGHPAGATGSDVAQPRGDAGVAGRDDSGVPGGIAERGRGDDGAPGRGRERDVAAERTGREGTARPGSRRAGAAGGVGAGGVAEAQPEEVELAEQAEELTDEEAAVIAGRMEARRARRTAMIMEVEGDESREDYVPSSALTAQGVKVPRNLAAATSRALERVRAEHGDLDAFVARQLGFDRPEELEGRLYAEQVDAVALCMWNVARGREMVLGDLTGIGKGRVLASMMRFAEQQNVPVIFVTKDLALFNSMAREMAVMGGAHLLDERRLLVTNSNGHIENEQGQVLVRARTPAQMREIIASGEIPEGVRVIFTTHSQLMQARKGYEPDGNRPATPNRAGWLLRAAQGAMVISDESHLSAGVDSNCGYNMRAIMQASRWGIHSSATSAKEAKNLSLYAGTDLAYLGGTTSLNDLLRKGGAAAMEAIPAMLAEEGQYIRREHDMSRADYAYPEVPEAVAARIRDEMDAVSTALRLLMQIQQAVSRLNAQANQHEAFNPPREENRMANIGRRLGLGSTHFASTLHHFSSQTLLALHADYYAELGLQAIARGEKPVFVVKDTMGAIASELADTLVEQQNTVPNGAVLQETYAGVLERLARRITELNITLDERRAYTVNLMDPLERTPRAVRGAAYRGVMELMRGTQGHILELMDQFQVALARIPASIPLSPLDRIRQRLEDAGHSMGELTGRTLRMQELEEGVYRIETRPGSSPRDRQKTMNGFNSGELTAVMFNRAGATGVDLHSDFRFADQRKRHMIVCQTDDDIYVFLQSMGRVFRANQAVPPSYSFPSFAVPVAVRSMSIMQRRLSSMLALTRGSRESEVGGGIPDIFNWVGSEAALNYLRNNADIARTLGIDMAAEERKVDSDSGDTGLANRLTALALLLPCDAQEELIDGVVREYEARLEDLERRGINPFRSRHLDLKARVLREVEIHPATGTSVFQAAVSLKEIEYQMEVPPLRGDIIRDLINVGRTELSMRGGAHRNWSTYPVADVLNTIRAKITRRQESSFDLFLRDQHATLEEARESTHDTAITRSERTRKLFEAVGPHLGIGASIHLLLGHEEPINFHIVNIDPPSHADYYDSPSDWRMRMISPVAYAREVNVPLSTVFADGIEMLKAHLAATTPAGEQVPPVDLTQVATQLFGRGMPNLTVDRDARTLSDEVLRVYDEAPAGTIPNTRYVLSGNLLKAIEIAGQERKGLPSTYTLADGTREFGVMMPNDYNGVQLINRPVLFTSPEDFGLYLSRAAARKSMPSMALVFGQPRIEGVTIPQRERENEHVNFMLDFKRSKTNNLIEVALTVPRAKNRSGWVVGHEPLKALLGAEWERAGSDLKLNVLRLRAEDMVTSPQVGVLLNHLLDLGMMPRSSSLDVEARRWLIETYRAREQEARPQIGRALEA